MSQFMLLLRGQGEWPVMSPSELQNAMQEYISWSKALQESGRNLGGDELEDTCRIVGPKPEVLVTEAPFAETREAVGGYFVIKADSLDEAVEIAKTCPHTSYGGSVEVRPIIEHPMQSLNDRLSQ